MAKEGQGRARDWARPPVGVQLARNLDSDLYRPSLPCSRRLLRAARGCWCYLSLLLTARRTAARWTSYYSRPAARSTHAVASSSSLVTWCGGWFLRGGTKSPKSEYIKSIMERRRQRTGPWAAKKGPSEGVCKQQQTPFATAIRQARHYRIIPNLGHANVSALIVSAYHSRAWAQLHDGLFVILSSFCK